jgi:glutaminyl-peptide cyclotransferase
MVKTSEAESKPVATPVAVRRRDPSEPGHPNTVSQDAVPSTKGGGLVLLVFLALAAVLLLVAIGGGVFDRGPVRTETPSIGAIPAAYDSERAFGYLQQLCDLGPRPSGSAAMARQQQMLQKFFSDRGASITLQTFDIRHPEDGSDVALANLIASWHPDRSKRYLLCAHYDTRPFPDQDRLNRRGTFIGANDGASGTAALMELANQMNDLPQDVGVDIVLFDGEEFVWQQGRDDYFLGSTFFARKYVASPPSIPYQAGILLDMIGDRELTIYYEQNSLRYAREVAKGIWRTADKLGVRAFVSRARHTIDDDHIPLNKIAGIPTVDLIDFDYPRVGMGAPSYWHTEQDIPENCSGDSLAAVVWVVHQWLKGQ